MNHDDVRVGILVRIEGIPDGPVMVVCGYNFFTRKDDIGIEVDLFWFDRNWGRQEATLRSCLLEEVTPS